MSQSCQVESYCATKIFQASPCCKRTKQYFIPIMKPRSNFCLKQKEHDLSGSIFQGETLKAETVRNYMAMAKGLSGALNVQRKAKEEAAFESRRASTIEMFA